MNPDLAVYSNLDSKPGTGSSYGADRAGSGARVEADDFEHIATFETGFAV